MEVADMKRMVSNDFAKLGCSSLAGISNECLKPRKSDYLSADYEPDEDFAIEMDVAVKNGLIKLHRVNDTISVFGIDTSNIILGDTGKGILCAVRGSIVWRANGTYQYIRHGPFIFHITEKNKYALYNALRQLYLDVDSNMGAPILEKLVERIRFILERWLQKQLCESTHDSLILWDGSLTTRTVNRSSPVLSELLHTAKINHNYILALSKETTISVSGRKLNELISNGFAPCLLDIDTAVRSCYSNQLNFLGRIYAAKLSPSPFTFRLDIDRRIPMEDGFNAVGQLLGNELLKDGYPETLRLAHIFSRFSASEVLAMQRYVSASYGLRIDSKPDVRQVLFGAYGGLNHKRMNGYDANL
ncbi:DNA double-strand break repair nuclease NurA [Candidatus Bathyarchaeota archaeon]|nr:DNA double-strand break repair nuclease NurA [Candidatus Bathyarchaeota archaeon]